MAAAKDNRPITYHLEAVNPVKVQIGEIFAYLDTHQDQTEGALYSLRELEKVLVQALSDTRHRIKRTERRAQIKTDYLKR
jgi:succinate dehydrogenase/fumarate reductase flavoprotein subunit